MPAPPSKEAVHSLYRSLLCESKRLPHEHLRQFYRIRAQDEFRRLITADKSRMRAKKFYRITKELTRVQRANDGNSMAFNHVLDMAYGRKGPLRYYLMKPFLTDASVPLPPRIMPSVPKSHPPQYTPELSALLSSDFSRISGKPLSAKDFRHPSTLPSRADPTSEDYRIFGPLSKRREVNIRWKFFTNQWKKTLPPLEMTIKSSHNLSSSDDDSNESSLPQQRGFLLQRMDLLREIKALAGPLDNKPPITKRQHHFERTLTPAKLSPDEVKSQSSISGATASSTTSTPFKSAPSRFLRRRYRELLGKVPVMVPQKLDNTSSGALPAYNVSLDPAALGGGDNIPGRHRYPNADATDLIWIAHGEQSAESRGKKLR